MQQEIQDFYKILEIDFNATEKEIRKSFRTKSLQYHPDRAGNDEKSSEMFHLISLALETLTNPIKKKIHDEKIIAEHARQARLKEMNKQQRTLREELEKREFEFKKSKAEAKTENKVEKLKEETRLKMQARMQMKKQTEIHKLQKIKILENLSKNQSSLIDCTVKIKWNKTAAIDEQKLWDSMSVFGEIEKIIMNKTGKHKANVIFKSVEGAFNAIYSESQSDFNITFAGDKEPEAFQLFRLQQNKEIQSEEPVYVNQTNRNQEYEEMTLKKLKQMQNH